VARDVVARAMGDAAVVSVSGYLPLYGRIVTSLVDDQIGSFFIAFFLVFGIIGLFLRSWRLLIVAIVPNVLPVGLVLGAMGFTGIRLDIATMTIAATILGIVVDDTVHVLYRIRLGLTRGGTVDEAIGEAIHTAGLANVVSNFVLMLGFLILSFATVKTVAYVGLLSCFAVGGAMLADLVLVPPLARAVLRPQGLALARPRTGELP
jgi:predicted RND superfamily exporter protein